MGKNKYEKILIKDFFINHYIKAKKSLNQIAKEFNISIDTIRFYFRKTGLQLRTVSEETKNREVSKKALYNMRMSGKDRRVGSYFNCKQCNKIYYLRLSEIENNTGYCSFDCKFEKVTFKDLKINTFSPSHLKFIYRKLLTKEFFEEHYYRLKKSKHQIELDFKIPVKMITKYMKLLGLKSKNISEFLKGRVFTEEHKKKIGCAHRGEKNNNYIDGRSIKLNYCMDCGKKLSNYKNKRCVNCFKNFNIGINHFCYKDNKPKCINCGKKLSALHCIRCEKCLHRFRRGKNHPMFGKIGAHARFCKYNITWFRSNWEANFAKWCDGSEIKWEYELKTFKLRNRSYTPDFYLPEFDCYIEIKGWWRLDSKEKFNNICKKYKDIDFIVFEKDKLKELGVI